MPFEDLLRCAICRDFASHPVLLRCNHLYCSLCLEKLQVQSQKCQVCGSTIDYNAIKPNAFLQELIESYKLERLGIADGAPQQFSCTDRTDDETLSDSDSGVGEAPPPVTALAGKSQAQEAQRSQQQGSQQLPRQVLQRKQSPKCVPPSEPQQKRVFSIDTLRQQLGLAQHPSKQRVIAEFSISDSSERGQVHRDELAFALHGPAQAQTQAIESVNEPVFTKIDCQVSLSETSDTEVADAQKIEKDMFAKPAIQCKVCQLFIKMPNYEAHIASCKPDNFCLIGRARMPRTSPAKKKCRYNYNENMSDIEVYEQLVKMGFENQLLLQKNNSEKRTLCKIACHNYALLNNDSEFYKNQEAILNMACQMTIQGQDSDIFVDLLKKLLMQQDRHYLDSVRSILLKKQSQFVDI